MTGMSGMSGMSGFGHWACFHLGDELFALPVEDVQRVIWQLAFTPVPLAPVHVAGMVNLRGQIVVSIDLRRLLDYPERPSQQAGALLVLRNQGELIGLLVDEVGDVIALPRDDWCSPPDTLAERHRGLVFGICPVGERLVLGLRAATLCKSVPTGTQASSP